MKNCLILNIYLKACMIFFLTDLNKFVFFFVYCVKIRNNYL